jgi:hypothetical protein
MKKIKHFLPFFFFSALFYFYCLDVIGYVKRNDTEWMALFVLFVFSDILFAAVTLAFIHGLLKNSRRYAEWCKEEEKEQEKMRQNRFWADVARHRYSRRRRR